MQPGPTCRKDAAWLTSRRGVPDRDVRAPEFSHPHTSRRNNHSGNDDNRRRGAETAEKSKICKARKLGAMAQNQEAPGGSRGTHEGAARCWPDAKQRG